MINSEYENYIINYPEEIKRVMDIVSVNISNFIGSKNENQNYFDSPNKNGDFNIGKLLTSNYSVTAGIPVVLNIKSLNRYELIQTGLIKNLFIYSLDDLADFLNLNEKNVQWRDYYEFYEFKNLPTNDYNDSIIDWNNPQTTISRNISSIFEWNGDQKYLDSLFSYYLHKGLVIF
jgi:hypothetical protein